MAKVGMETFDPASKAYDAEGVRKERQLYGGGIRWIKRTARFGGSFFVSMHQNHGRQIDVIYPRPHRKPVGCISLIATKMFLLPQP